MPYVDGIAYSRVCGKVKAYQYYSPNAFGPYYHNRALTIDDIYVDGVSLTHGQNPRKHIWTFANAIDEVRSNEWVCPCTKTDTPYTGVVPPFVGNDYFCDTAWKPIQLCKAVLQRGPTMGWSWVWGYQHLLSV